MVKMDKEQDDLIRLAKTDPIAFNRMLYAKKKKAEEQEELAALRSSFSPKPKCPTCGSACVHTIGMIRRAMSVKVIGLASPDLGKSMECENCGYRW